MPEKTIAAFLDHGTVVETVEQAVEDAVQVMGALGRLDIDFDDVATQLENEGIQKFIEPYEALMRHIGGAGHSG
jgi:transketolase